MHDSLFLLDHPILQHKLTVLRNKNTESDAFRRTMQETARLIAYEACRDLTLEPIEIQTPMAPTTAPMIAQNPIVAPILRAGNGMLEGILQMLPMASAGHIGIYKDRFINNTVEYYFRLPSNVKSKLVLLLDPILATGDTVLASIDRLKQYEVGEIRMLAFLVSKTALKKMQRYHPDVKIYAIAIEEEIDERGFLIPGIGDAGNRLFRN